MRAISFVNPEGTPLPVSAANPLPVAGEFNISGGLTNAELRASPIAITGDLSISGGLTDIELRASPVPVSGTFYPATQTVAGTVSVANFPATQAISGTVGVSGSVAVTGPLTDAQLRAGAVPVSGAFWQATQPVSIAATVTTRDAKDTGRTPFSCATVIGGVTAVTTEALLTMVPTRAGVASGTTTSHSVTSGKTLRIQSITVGYISTAAAVLSMRFALRINPAGAVAANSPILRIIPVSQRAAALAQAGNEMTVEFPDGLELSGTQQFGITQIGSAATGTCWASVVGYEY